MSFCFSSFHLIFILLSYCPLLTPLFYLYREWNVALLQACYKLIWIHVLHLHLSKRNQHKHNEAATESQYFVQKILLYKNSVTVGTLNIYLYKQIRLQHAIEYREINWIQTYLTIDSATFLATNTPNSCSTNVIANSKEVPGPRLVVSSPETWIFYLTAQKVGSFSLNAGWHIILQRKLDNS